MNFMEMHNFRDDIAKRIAALLAENAATLGDLDEIFKLVKDHLTLTLRSGS